MKATNFFFFLLKLLPEIVEVPIVNYKGMAAGIVPREFFEQQKADEKQNIGYSAGILIELISIIKNHI